MSLPSFIDGHVHLESSMLMPSEFAKMVVPSGTTTVVADPHEISNVMGLQGISFMREATKNLPLDVYMTLPSCVPATSLETSGVDLNSYDLALLIDAPWVLGIAEMMNFPGVINCDSSVLSKVRLGLEKHKRVDGMLRICPEKLLTLMLQQVSARTMSAPLLKKLLKNCASVCI